MGNNSFDGEKNYGDALKKCLSNYPRKSYVLCINEMMSSIAFMYDTVGKKDEKYIFGCNFSCTKGLISKVMNYSSASKLLFQKSLTFSGLNFHN